LGVIIAEIKDFSISIERKGKHFMIGVNIVGVAKFFLQQQQQN